MHKLLNGTNNRKCLSPFSTLNSSAREKLRVLDFFLDFVFLRFNYTFTLTADQLAMPPLHVLNVT